MGWTSVYALQNESGERYDLTPPAPVYLVNVKGLGTKEKLTLESLNNGFFLQTDADVPNNPIQGTLMYVSGAFGNYQNLVNWIYSAKELFFVYAPADTEYFCRVKLNYIDKDKRSGSGVMEAAISMNPLTPFYLPTPTGIDVPRAGADCKGYPLDSNENDYGYHYNSALRYGPELGGDLSALIVPAGHVPAAFLLKYTGSITNPTITLTGQQTGKVYGKCEITATFSGSDVLELCTAQRDSYVRKTSSGVTTDLMATGAVNLAFEPYPRAPIDEPSAITVTDGNDDPITGSAELTVYSYFRSV